MSAVSGAAQDTLECAMSGQGDTPTLRFITCGSVDDGKSTLIGRLLYDSKLLFDDQLAALESESKTYGTVGDSLDFALLVDGLQAEREQGITIDVAYRFFTTPKRRFIVADTPGHEQYTRNMATGASNAELAVVLVDARKGVVTQTRRHSYILALFGIRHVVLAVNKMDLVGYDPARFDEIVAAYRAMADRLAIPHVQAIPVSARDGDNIFDRSLNMRWYSGPTVLEYLETVDVVGDLESKPFRLPVQWVNRPNADFRGYSGRIAGGVVRLGDTVTVHPSTRSSRVARILAGDVDADRASAGDSVTLVLSDEIDVSRGNVLAAADVPPLVADQLAAHILWFDDAAMLPGRRYVMKCGAQTAGAVISTLKHRVSVDTMEHQAATTLKLNEIGSVNLGLDRPIACAAYVDNREMGGFILVDAFSHHTVAAGVIDFALRRASNVAWQELDIDKAVRARLKHQRPCVLWFTGLSGAGKSTVANLVDKQLCGLGRHTYLVDGDNIRHGLNRDLGFTVEARVENIRRVAEVAKLFVDAGLIVMVSLISPFRAERQMARELLAPGEFIEIHMATPLAECERRDPKGLYRRARAGQIPNFTGIDSPYEPPEAPEITLDTSLITSDEASEQVLAYLRDRQYV